MKYFPIAIIDSYNTFRVHHPIIITKRLTQSSAAAALTIHENVEFLLTFFTKPNQHLWSFPNSKGFSTFSHTTVSAYDYYVEPGGVESDKKKNQSCIFG